MQLKFLILAFLAHFTTGIKQVSPTNPQTICQTVQGTKHVTSIPTSTRMHSETYVISSTTIEQNVITVTPTAVTSTTNATVVLTIITTPDAETDSIQIVATEYNTTTITLPIATFTVTSAISTDTTIFTTSVIPTPAGFLPIQDTLPGIMDPGNGASAKRRLRNGAVPRRDERQQNPRSPATPTVAAAKGPSPGFPLKNLYPQKVVCEVTTWVTKTVAVTKSKYPATITANTPVVIVTSTATITDTSTIVPDQVTVFDTSTTLAPNSTVTATTVLYTATVQVPESTFVAMCASDNFGSMLNGVGYGSFNVKFNAGIWPVTSTSDYDCCSQCFYNQDCLGFTFRLPFNSCYLIEQLDPACSPSNICSGSIGYVLPYSDPYVYTFGNGPALQWTGTFQYSG